MKTTADSAPVIGLDLVDRPHTVCVLDAVGESLAECFRTNTRATSRDATAYSGPAWALKFANKAWSLAFVAKSIVHKAPSIAFDAKGGAFVA